MPFHDGEIDLVLRDYICAQCYSDLQKEPTENRRWIASCPNCGDVEVVGRITRFSAERLAQKLAWRYKEIRDREILRNGPSGKTEAELIKSLGI